MDRIRSLDNPIRHYAWGSRTFLARLQGRSAPTREPEAELWIGAHPVAPSLVVIGEDRVPLPEWIARDPDAVLGRDVAARFGGELPFLLKILAVKEPLSLQVHPDATCAREGFEREDRAGVSLDAPERCYRDSHPKPELLCALSEFEALVGLRPLSGLRGALGSFDATGLRSFVEGPGQTAAAARMREAFAALLALPASECAALVARAARAARLRSDSEPESLWLVRLAEQWPGDPMALAPYLLHHVRLAPGEAVFVAPGTLHSYLAGAAVEVQAASDNVLRAGLTHKHIDPKELLAVAGFESTAPCTPPSTGGAGVRVFHTPTPEFELTSEAVGADDRLREKGPTVEVLLCTEGCVALADAGGGRLLLGPGAAALVPAAALRYRLRGPARLFRVRVGDVGADAPSGGNPAGLGRTT